MEERLLEVRKINSFCREEKICIMNFRIIPNKGDKIIIQGKDCKESYFVNHRIFNEDGYIKAVVVQ